MKTICTFVLSAIVVTAAALSPSITKAMQKMDPVTITDMRGMRYCEFLLIYEDRVEVFNTSGSAGGCPAEIWDVLDTNELAKAHGAIKAQLNGPKFWAADEQVMGLGTIKDFGGIEARYAATLPLSAIGAGEGSDPYAPFTTKKEQKLTYLKGQPVYELVDKNGSAFVLNAYGAKVEGGDPANLADQLSPAEGWTFRVRVLDEDFVKIHKGDTPSKMVGDDLHQYYSLEIND
jgi:hypothetical protein